MKTIGILALQGDFEKHEKILSALGVKSVLVRTRTDLADLDGIIFPGGESTTIGKLLERFSLLEPIKDRIDSGLPVFATCAGMILLAKDIEESNQTRFGILDISIKRNAYGPQIESFETDILVPELGSNPVRGVFIRAPMITKTGKNVSVLAEFEEMPVLIRESNILASTFHPELAGELRIHKFFIESMK